MTTSGGKLGSDFSPEFTTLRVGKSERLQRALQHACNNTARYPCRPKGLQVPREVNPRAQVLEIGFPTLRVGKYKRWWQPARTLQALHIILIGCKCQGR